MATVNLTVRVDERTKREFDVFCDNVGINATAAVNMFIKNVVRTRTLPFIVTDLSKRVSVKFGEIVKPLNVAITLPAFTLDASA